MKRSDRIKVLMALAAGAAAGWYLNSDEGRKKRVEAKHRIDEASVKARDTVADQTEQLTNKLNALLERGETYISDLNNVLKSALDSTKNKAQYALDTTRNKAKSVLDRAEDDVHHGAQQAERTLQEHAENLKSSNQ